MDELHRTITERGYTQYMVVEAAPCDGGLQIAHVIDGEDAGEAAQRYDGIIVDYPAGWFAACANYRAAERRQREDDDHYQVMLDAMESTA